MSYILEALKKAQAERQLGNAPTIHAAPPSYATPGADAGNGRRYLAIGLGAGALIAVAALLWVRYAAAPKVVTPPAAAVAVVVPAPVIVPAPVPVPVPVAPPLAPPVVKPAPAPKVAKVREPAPAPAPQPEPVRAPASGDDTLRSLQQLPDALQREIPKVVVGGYIYSPTPGESLLLVDKMLRREGEEVAPGLVLERLTPKAAVMNYRGTRYRVAY